VSNRNEMSFDYPFEEWNEDWAAILKATSMTPEEKPREYLQELFRSRYTNPDEAYWKQHRVASACLYMRHHSDSFEEAGWLLRTSEEMTVNPHLTIALYRIYSIGTDALLLNPPSPQVVIIAANDQWALNGP
jgi:hypothetical protein